MEKVTFSSHFDLETFFSFCNLTQKIIFATFLFNYKNNYDRQANNFHQYQNISLYDHFDAKTKLLSFYGPKLARTYLRLKIEP